ncbi:MAG: branched-chain amino acid ABC transporter permease [Chloroflexi bacterium]|nr:branched-chain amino acid ABC transporter permease [Chloroflexota bacterium]
MFKGLPETRTFVAVAAIVAILLALPFLASEFYIYILALIFVTALLAMSLNLVLGYGGIYQFHHAVFYGVGAYAAALLITRARVPWELSMIVAPFVAALTGLVIGWFCIRLTKLYFGMLQISLGSLIWIIVFRWYDFTGGDNGIHNIPIPAFLTSTNAAYYFVLAILVLCLFVLYRLVKSPFGATLQAIRDNPQRCEAVGINVRQHQLLAIVIASFFAGIAGALFVTLERSVFPDMLFWVLSLEVFVMCLLGGWFTFPGPILGAALVVALRTFSSKYTDYYTTILGVVLILLIFFLPEGVMGFVLEKLKPATRAVEGAQQLDVERSRGV